MKWTIDGRIAAANLAVVALAVLSYLSLAGLHLRYPVNGMVTDDRTPEFSWYGQPRSYELLIDEDQGFATPMSFAVSGNSHALERELDFGTYWWKVRSGDLESEAGSFTLVSTVALSRLRPGLLRNSGNVPLLMHVDGMTGAATLGVNRTLEIEEEADVKAEQK